MTEMNPVKNGLVRNVQRVFNYFVNNHVWGLTFIFNSFVKSRFSPSCFYSIMMGLHGNSTEEYHSFEKSPELLPKVESWRFAELPHIKVFFVIYYFTEIEIA